MSPHKYVFVVIDLFIFIIIFQLLSNYLRFNFYESELVHEDKINSKGYQILNWVFFQNYLKE